MHRLFRWLDPLFGMTLVFALLMALLTAWPGAATAAAAHVLLKQSIAGSGALTRR